MHGESEFRKVLVDDLGSFLKALFLSNKYLCTDLKVVRVHVQCGNVLEVAGRSYFAWFLLYTST